MFSYVEPLDENSHGISPVSVTKILLGLYFFQMLLGLATGFAVPWLHYWGFI
jgi:hypothetical protein